MVFGGKASGFASPAQGYEEQGIDLNRLLVRNPSATYFFRLDSGDMEQLGLPKGALLVVDRSKTPNIQKSNSIVIIRHDGQFFCRLMTKKNGKIVFTNKISDIFPSTDTMTDPIEIIGVVTASINFLNHQLDHRMEHPETNHPQTDGSINYDFSY